jgi:tol-pal system protein YbgF
MTNTEDDTSVVNQKELYQEAYETLRNGQNARAIEDFELLIAKFPEGEYADNAQYWLGEAYKANQDYKSAKKAFKKVVKRYSRSPKVADALLKLGYLEIEQKNMAKARDYLTKVTVGYPGTTAAHLANKKLMQMGTPEL